MGDESCWDTSAVSKGRWGFWPPNGFWRVFTKPASSHWNALRETLASLCSGLSLGTRFDSKPPWNKTFPSLPLLKSPSTAVINFCRCSMVLTKCDCDLEWQEGQKQANKKAALMRYEVQWTDVLHWILLQSSHPLNTCEFLITVNNCPFWSHYEQLSFLVSEMDRQDDPNLLCVHFRLLVCKSVSKCLVKCF